jgi:hypothetical protein
MVEIAAAAATDRVTAQAPEAPICNFAGGELYKAGIDARKRMREGGQRSKRIPTQKTQTIVFLLFQVTPTLPERKER